MFYVLYFFHLVVLQVDQITNQIRCLIGFWSRISGAELSNKKIPYSVFVLVSTCLYEGDSLRVCLKYAA